ncbi:LeuA family protein [Papillibacter cinnamivorans]|uniref:2-isopropylmalate synthase n=1 Tax=Papillibacter cinnamivorans DSM 12816 TaxID=1122930 RepID=A0A1W2AI95_9FIRM|nr:LeuA family protein [Papillibacter cinnamivorans]SMC60425.1 2-isopropylmalate synthase [Papillibacter cinnamivorans DSM 12816]
MSCKTNEYWVTEFNYLDEVTETLDIPERVEIYDVTLREGNQTPGCIMRKEEQFALAKDLDDLGVNFLEFFPAVSKDDEEVVTELMKTGVLKHAKVSALVRPRTIDLDLAAKCGAKHIFLEGPSHLASAGLMGYASESELIQSFVDTAKRAREYGMGITSCPWDCGKANLPLLERWVKELAAAGVEDIAYGDTFGYTMPWTTIAMVRKYRQWAGPDVTISCHFHNDYGMATAGTLAAVAGGATRVQVAMNNLGERAGNAALDEVAVNLALNMGVKTDINLKKLYPVSKRIEAITKIPVGRKKPILGDETFVMGSGIVVDMLLQLAEKHAEYGMMPFDPALVGQPPYRIVYGKGAGTNMVSDLLRRMGISATKEQVQKITVAIKEEALLTKSLLSEFRVRELIGDILAETK